MEASKTIALAAVIVRIILGGAYTMYQGALKISCIPTLYPPTKIVKPCASVDFRPYRKPMFLGFVYMASSVFALPLYIINMIVSKRKPQMTLRDYVLPAIPGALEAVGQIILMTATIYVKASIASMIKGSRIMFTAVLLTLVLKRRLYAYHWFAASVATVGVLLASMSEILNMMYSGDSSSGDDPVLGVILAFTGEFIRVVRSIVEEKMLKGRNLDSLYLAGCEGVYGALIAIVAWVAASHIQYPSGVNGVYEDLNDTLYGFANSTMVQGMILTVPILVIAAYVTGIYITKHLSAVHYALSSVLTSGFVFVAQVTMYHGVFGGSYGEKWHQFAPLQVFGFIIIVIGSLMYDADIRLPWFYYPADKNEASGIGAKRTESTELKTFASVPLGDGLSIQETESTMECDLKVSRSEERLA